MSARNLVGDSPARREALIAAIRSGETQINGIDYVIATVAGDSFEIKLHLLADLKGVHDPFLTGKSDAESRVLLTKSLRLVSSQGHELNIKDVAKHNWYIKFTIDDDTAQVGAKYRLQLVDPRNRERPLPGVDPRHSQVDLMLQAANPHTGTDSRAPASLPQPIGSEPELNYLAKDYASFKQLILDRMALTMPNWQERHAADFGITIVELLAYAGDRLSYFQDAVATEAYLRTARERISVRRHARLVDYRVHEGCCARALVDVRVTDDIELEKEQLFFITTPPASYQLDNVVLAEADLPLEIFDDVETFEPLVASRSAMLNRCDVRDEDSVRKELIKHWTLIRSSDLDASKAVGGMSLDDLVVSLNQVLQDFELLTPDLEKRIGAATYQAALLRKAAGDRSGSNRIVLDELLREGLSSSKLDGRIRLCHHHNRIRLYAWGEDECWLPSGATTATLIDEQEDAETTNCSLLRENSNARILHLGAGDLLIFEEVRGPKTGQDADADATHRQAVRLVCVTRTKDPVTETLLLEVEWHREDALRFPLCISSRQSAPQCQPVTDVTVGRGNVVLVDHGRTIPYERLGAVGGQWRQINCGSDCVPPRRVLQHEPFRPALSKPRLAYSEPTVADASVQKLFDRDPRSAEPRIQLVGTPSTLADGSGLLAPADLFRPERLLQTYARLAANTEQNEIRFSLEELLDAETVYQLSERLPKLSANERRELGERVAYQLRRAGSWQPQYDLINSGPDSQDFVVEMDNRRRAYLRFGDGRLGQQPRVATQFFATYRVGDAEAGNVGAESISRMVTLNGTGSAVSMVRNPLPASGGTPPETIQEVKLFAPHDARQRQQRAVTDRDYVALVMREYGDVVQNASAWIGWSGSYWCVQVVVDLFSAVPDADALIAKIQLRLQRYRRLWHRVDVAAGLRVPIDLGLKACVRDGHLQSEIRRELLNMFSNLDLTEGRRGFFHPDNLSFGKSIYVSEIIAAAKKVAGVENVAVTHLCRLGISTNVADGTAAATNVLPIGPLEIAQLDNAGGDENGRLCLVLEGGR